MKTFFVFMLLVFVASVADAQRDIACGKWLFEGVVEKDAAGKWLLILGKRSESEMRIKFISHPPLRLMRQKHGLKVLAEVGIAKPCQDSCEADLLAVKKVFGPFHRLRPAFMPEGRKPAATYKGCGK